LNIREPFLVIAVRDSSQELIELEAVIPFNFSRDHSIQSILWGQSWEMMTPLDLIPHGCTLHIDLCSFPDLSHSPENTLRSTPSPPRRKPSGPKFFSQFFRSSPSSSSSTAPSPLVESLQNMSPGFLLNDPHRKVIATSKLSLDLYKIDTTNKSIEFHFPAEELVGKIDNATHFLSSRLHSTLDLYLSLHSDPAHVISSFNLNSYRLQPEWIHHHRPLPLDGVRCGDVCISSVEIPSQDGLSTLVTPINFLKFFHFFAPPRPSPSSSDHLNNSLSTSSQSLNLIDDISIEEISKMTFPELKYYLEKKKINWKRYVKTIMKRALIIAKEEGKFSS
jgi:hypothetical protein